MENLTKRFKALALLFALIMLNASAALAQVTATGTVKDSGGEPLIGASVIEKGTKNGTSTDIDGRFSLNVKQGATLVFSYIGYKTVEMKASADMNISLSEDTDMLDEVVVIGYGSVRRGDVTTAISSVSQKDLENRPIVSAAQAIQGKAAGVSVTSPNGAPGGEMTIRVRGTTSFNGSNDPLYVVDGVPVDNINFLAPSDIADIQILKDASSAAIYGSRAANGVILITSKSANTEKPSVSLTAQFGWSKVRRSMDVLNAQQYRELQDEIGLISLPENLTDRTDWFDEIYRTGTTQNYQLSISQNTGRTKYLMNLGYLDQDGVIKPSFYKRYNFRVNVDTKIAEWLSASANIVYSDYTSNGINTGNGANRGGVVLSVINTPTYAPVWDPENPDQYYTNFYGVNITSPSENLARNKNSRNKENRLIASGNLHFDILPGFTFNTKFTLDRRNSKNTDFVDPVSTNYGRENYGIGSDTRANNQLLVWDNVLNYVRDFGKHRIDVMAGTSWTDSKWDQSYIQGYNYRSDDIQTLNAANRINWTNTGTNASAWTIMSYFGRASYNFDNRYLVTANVRADGSSKLHPDHRWGVFPSFSAAWRISQESFLRDVQWIDDLKLRAGWGQTGNQAGLAEYGWMQQYSTNYYDWTLTENAQAVPTVGGRSNIKNEDLTWETSSQTNVGLDFALLNNRLSLSLDYYYKYTKDMLMSVPLPSPYPNITRNDGEMSNQGFEITLSSVNIARKDFNWSTDLNVSLNRNKVEKLNLKQVYYYATTSDATNDNVVRMTPGHPLSMFWGYVSKGVDPETGDLVYEDRNGDGEITPLDKTWIGNANPKFTFGMTNNFSWKGLNLNILITGSYGNDIFNASRIETEGMASANNQTTTVLRRWRIPGQQTDVFRSDNPAWNVKNSSYWVEDGSYLKVKNITLSYDITSPKLKRINITRIQPYISLQNFITWTGYSGYDPEVSQSESATQMGIDWGTYPNVRTVVVGLNLTF